MTTGRRVGAYVFLAYALSWAWWLPIALTGRTVQPGGWPTQLPGLLGPAVAAFLAISAADRVAFWHRLVRWRIGWRWWLVALSPLPLAGVGYAVHGVVANLPMDTADFWRINGFPISWGLVGTLVLLVVVNGFGEETGWRGFLQPALAQRMRPLWAFLAVAAIWAGWHVPLFVILSSYRGFDGLTVVGFAFGLACGAVVLGWLYQRTGSVLAVAIWHAGYNLAVAPVAARGTVAAVVTTAVMVAAVALILADVRTRGRVFAPSVSDAQGPKVPVR